ncbi:MAG: MBOAT family protein [Lachnospiraceae bacterium]|nr:MBOAT family protein [Lachnospiraceae bacterium]
MAFSSLNFICFFAILYLILWICRGILIKNNNICLQTTKYILLAASYIFICLTNWRWAVYLLFITVITFVIALLIQKNEKAKKLIMAVGVSICILGLCFFKYFNFFIDTFNNWFGASVPFLNIAAPIGISFYTFSAIGYIIDIYRGEYKVETSFFNVAIYFSFFPKLVSGPLVGAKDFFEQLKDYKGIKLANLEEGIQIFAIGLFKKIVLADHLGVFVDDVYNAPTAFSTPTVILAVISYSLQLYFDFSGYSDMAIGIAKILGFDLCKNFNLPYISMNLTEFWKRWHISLSAWLQKYLYISLGGNRKGKIRTYINLFLVMLIGGLWHGAGWTFIAWGALHGLGLVIHKLFMNFKIRTWGDKNAGNIIWKATSVILTYIYVAICWVFFRADSFENAINVIKGMFVYQNGISQIYAWSLFAIAILLIATIVACVKSRNNKRVDAFYPLQDLSTVKGLLIFFVFVGLTICMAYFGNTAFIYGKF